MDHRLKRELPLHLMLIVPLLVIIVFSYVPMAGIIIAFQRFIPARGLFGDQRWVGFDNFAYVFQLPSVLRALKNTIVIAFLKIVFGQLTPIVFALLINELFNVKLKKAIQTSIYLPHFLSWVILAGVLIDILSPRYGLLNRLLGGFGIEPVFFLGDNDWFQFTMVVTHVWKEFGFGTIIYLAAITTIDPQQYEAAHIDGASRWRQMWHITLPGMTMIIVLIAVLNLGDVLNAGFEQIFNLYSPQTYETGDILDTLIYRLGLLEAQFGPSTAIGLFKSVVSLLFISVSYVLAYRLANYRVF
ncbi:MAG: ABC transporter permease subunit [Spirochaetaceae bacterium]|nr:ABC transporter permease subunit [Spirochaetaceae bacterium]